jgi:VWFA-related protein
MKVIAGRAFLSVGFLFLLLPCTLSQTQKQSSPDQAIKLSTDLVLIEADVLNKKTGQAVRGLSKEDFVIYEDEVKQEITHFSQDRLPLSVLLLIDVSGSVWPRIKRLREGALESLRNLKPEDEVAVMVFAVRPRLTLPFTKDKQLAARAIEEASGDKVGAATDSNEAVFQAAAYIKNATNPDKRRVIVAISDDISTDKVLLSKKAKTIHELFESGGVLCGLFFDSIYKEKPEPPTDPYQGVLQTPLIVGEIDLIKSYVDRTGGIAIKADQENIKDRFNHLIERLRTRYNFGYVSSNEKRDGKFRKIRLRISPDVYKREKGVAVVTRKGYNAPRSDGAGGVPE